MRLLLAAFVLASFALQGCAVLPSQVVMPPQAGPAASGPGSYQALIKPVENYAGVRPKEVDFARLRDQLTLYIGTWRKHSSDLLAGRDLSDNGMFWGTVYAGVSAVREKIGEAKRAGAAVGLLALVQDKYNVQAQATNYKNAAEAMSCIRHEVEAVHPAAWKYFQPGTGKVAMKPDGGTPAPEAIAQLDRLFDDVNSSMGRIADHLRSLLEAQRIGTISVADIRALAEQAKKNAEEVKAMGNPSIRVSTAGLDTDVAKSRVLIDGDTIPDSVVKSLLELKGKVGECASTFAGTS